MKMKKAVVKQIKDMMDNFKPDTLPPCEPANVKFTASSQIVSVCKKFGKIHLQQTAPEKCFATGKGLEVASAGEKATVVLHGVDHKGKACTMLAENVTCELTSEITSMIAESATNQLIEGGTSCTSKWRVSTSKEVHLLSL